MKHYFTSKLLLLVCVLLGFSGNISAQNYKTVRFIDFTNLSEATLADLAADAANWTPRTDEWAEEPGKLSRYVNAKDLSSPLKANGNEIVEFAGLSLPTMKSGKITLRINMPDVTANGYQAGAEGKYTMVDLKKGQRVTIVSRSPGDDGGRGLSAASNMTCTSGNLGTYAADGSDVTYVFTVDGDGSVTFTSNKALLIKSIKVEEEAITPKVAFLCTAAYDVESDPSYKALNDAYEVTKVDIVTVTDPVDLISYDLVVVNSSIEGKDANAKNLPTIVNAVPMLNFKSFFYNTGRWDWGSGANPSPASRTMTVQPDFKSHAIFNGVTLGEKDTLTVFNEVEVADRTNLVQGYNSPAAIIASDNVLAKVGELNAIHEHKAESGKNTYMLIPFEQTYVTSLTEDAVKLIMNAAAYLIATKAISVTVDTPEISYEQNGNEVKVTITCATDGAKIYYTTDGSTPNENSKLYEGAFNIIKSCTVKAVAMKEDMVNSEVAELEIENPNYVARNKTLLWINFNDKPQDWEQNADGKSITDLIGSSKGGATKKVTRAGFTIDGYQTRATLMHEGTSLEGASSKCLQMLTGASNSNATCYIITPDTYQGPFDVTAWYSSSNGSSQKFKAFVSTDGEAWTELGVVSTSSKSGVKQAISYDGKEKVYVKMGGDLSGGKKIGIKIFDIKIFGEGDDHLVSITNEEVNKEVEACEYYSISGMRLACPEKGINLVKTVYTDGSVETSKVIVK